MKNLSLIILLLLINLPGFALNGPCTPGSAGTGFSGTTTYCAGAVATALNYNYAECSVGSGAATGVSCTATWYYNTTNTTGISGSTVTVSGPTVFNSAAGANGNLPTVTPITTTAGTYYYFCVVSWAAGGTCASSFTTGTQAITINPNPSAITGPNTVCVGSTITLSDALTGGTWSSSNVGQASVGSATGIVTGVGGTASPVITYILPTGCKTTTTITVNVLPAAILGTTTACAGLTTSISDGTAGGTWSSSNTAVATIGTTHIVTGIAAGTATMSYSLATGCYKTITVTINQSPAAITGTAAACIGSTTTLSNTVAGGVWSSSNTALATVASTGVVTYVAVGNPVIAYTMATGCKSTLTVTGNAVPAAITGTLSVCAGLTTAINDATAGGTWSSTNTAVGTIGTAHIVAGISAGTTSISYTMPTGCYKTTTVTVNAIPASISGANGVCKSATMTLSDANAGGAWSSSLTTVATISNTGVVTGVAASGSTTIAYTFANGCKNTMVVSINPAPSGITGSLTACVGYTTTLSDVTAGGTWSSANTAIATVGSSTGVVTGVTTGSAKISYTLNNGCITTYNETINPVPVAITGTKTACPGATTALTDVTAGSLSWTSSNAAVATVVNSGTVTGVAAGTSTITYKIISGCFATTTVTVIANAAAINGANTACVNGYATLTDAASSTLWTSTWSSSNVSVAIIGSANGTIAGVTTGTATITFSTGCGANTTRVITINPAPAVVTGTNVVCTGLTTTLSDATSGGTWSSSNTAVATVNFAALVTGVSAGTATVSYTIANGCFATNTVTINANPTTVTVSGGGAFCNNTTLVASNGGSGTIYYEGTTSGGSSTATPSVSQAINASGTYYFRAQSAAGCWSTQGSASVSVNALPAITNNATLCPGSSATLSDATSGGTWSSSNTAIATIGSSTGTVSAVYTGTATITYSIGSISGCKTTVVVTVNNVPTVSTNVISPITKGNTSIPLHFYTTGAPSNYNLAWCTAAHTVGFSDVTAGRLDTLAQDTVLHISIPSNATVAMYTATLSVTSSGCTSRGTLVRAIITDSLNIYTFAGTGINGNTGNGGAATASKISHPSSVASDCNGNTYIADYDNGVVRKVDARGIITTFAGNGTIGYSGDGGPATSAQLSNPTGVAIDGSGNVYISDYNNMVVRKVSTTGIITTFAGNGGHGYSGDNGPATSAELNYPVGLAVDNANNVYIADNLNSVIRMVNAAGNIYTVAGDGTTGYSGDGGSATNASLSNPRGVAVDAAGNLYITDYGNNAIRKVNASGTISTYAGIGIAGYSGDGNSAAYAELNTPWGIAVDNYGDVYFSELQNNVIRKIDTNGIIITIGGNNAMWRGYTGDGGSAVNAQLDQPMGIAINCSGNLYIADNANYAVRILGQYNRAPYFVNGDSQVIYANQSNPVTSLSTVLTVNDFDTAQTETWSVVTNAAHGTVSVSYTTTSTGSSLVPSGVSYTPAPGYIGPDQFEIQVTDGKAFATTIVLYVTVTSTGGRMSNPATGVTNTTENNISMQVFPNPSRGTFNLKTSGTGTFYLFSMEGKSVGEYEVAGQETVINIPGNMPSGIYIGRFKDTDGNTKDVKLVYEN